MMDMATEPVTYSRERTESINRRIHSILNGPYIIPQSRKAILSLAAEAFVAKSYKKSAKYFTTALDSACGMAETGKSEEIILTKYMLCMCWLESTYAKDLLEALKNLEELERNHGSAYPMLYYAIGKAYFKLYRFSKADEILKKGFSILNDDIELNEHKIPGTDVVIHESLKDRLVAALATLNDQCSSWHRPDAVCCMPDCSSHSQNESADKNIFFGNPTFNGMVQVRCNNTASICTVSFHAACWKAKKENLSSLRKLSDKDLLNWECFTPNCEDQGVRCTIKKIEIFDENAKVKATIEPRVDEIAKHAKVQPPPPKGAIRKQQQQQQHPKAKITTNEPRAPLERNPRTPNNVPHEINKVDEAEDDDDLHDEQALRRGIEQLIELRANNFGINDEKIWRPNLPMYGNEFMLATVDALPDPEFSDKGQDEAELKAFVFSYFYTFIAKSGPMKLDHLNEKWHEAKNMIENCESVLKNYIDLTEFLLQSVKFAVIGDYICVAEKLPEAYDLTKTDACETLRFFMENDIDQRSNSSSVDDEAFFNDIVNQEKNNNDLPYSSISGETKTGVEDLNLVNDEPTDKNGKTTEPSFDGLDLSKIGAPLQQTTPIRKKDSTPVESGNEKSDKKKPTIDNQLPEFSPVSKVVTLIKSFAVKRPHSLEYANDEVYNCVETKTPIATRDEKREEPSPKATNGYGHVHAIESHIAFPSKPMNMTEKFTKESKSVNDIDTYFPSSKKDHGSSMNYSGEPDKRPNETFSSSPIVVNGVTNTEKASNNCSCSKNDELLLGELREEVQRLTNKLAISEGRAAELEADVVKIKETHAMEKVKLLKKNLQAQYAFNHSLIIRKLEECRKNYDIISGVQALLMTSIGRNLPISGVEHQKFMADMEKISKSLQAKFLELSVKLETTEPEKITEVDLQPDSMPSSPVIEVPEVIQSAFGMYAMQHHMKELQSLQFRPNYNYNNTGMGMFPPHFVPRVSPPAPPPAPPPPSSVNVCIPPPMYSTLPKQIDHLVPPRPKPAPVIPKITNSPQRQNPPAHFQPLNAFAIVPSSDCSSSSTAQPNVFKPVEQAQSSSISSPLRSSLPKINDSSLQKNHQTFEESNSENVQASDKSNICAQKKDKSNDNSSVKSRPSPVPSTFSNNSEDHFDMRIVENVTSYDTYVNPKTLTEPKKNDYTSAQSKETKTRKKNYHSMDKLMQTLRSRYVGVLEFDLLKSVELVRKNHNNSLSRMSINQIIREAEKDIMNRQQKQLCGYEKRQTQFFSTPNPSASFTIDADSKHETSMSSASSWKKGSHGLFASKKKWEPVVIPNDTWHKETPESECVICFETMTNMTGTALCTLHCKHTFHATCIKHWYTQNQSCPTCRVHSTIDDEYPPLPLG